MAAVIAVGAFLLRPSRVAVTALFQVGPKTSGLWSETGNEARFESLKKTQAALPKSNLVLNVALRDPKLSSLSILSDQSDPVKWLQEHLEVSFPENGEILAISLQGAKSQQHELVSIVDAVGKAYLNEVVSEQRMQYLATCDLLARNIENLNNEIKRKLDEYLDIARGSPSPKSYYYSDFEQFDSKQLVNEINQLQRELAVETAEDSPKSAAQYVSELRARQTKMMNELRSRLSGTAGMAMIYRHRDLEQLQQIAHDMAMNLEKLDAAAASPEQIRQVQNAIITQD
jgi:NhaP-type Na+/H+ and K+/H+ antiporter